MSTIVVPLLKANVSTFRSLGANILGAAVQNNAKAQISALKAGVIPLLLHNIASNADLEVFISLFHVIRSMLVHKFFVNEVFCLLSGAIEFIVCIIVFSQIVSIG